MPRVSGGRTLKIEQQRQQSTKDEAQIGERSLMVLRLLVNPLENTNQNEVMRAIELL